MDAFQLLKNDHKLVSALFEEIESASGQKKSTLFNRLKQELDVHAEVEERFFYPALENKKEARDITLEAYEEHKVVKDLLAELANGGTPEDEWDAKLKVLKENVEHHVEEEEGELFDKAGDVLSDDEVDQIGTEMEAEKRRQLGTDSAARSSRTAKSDTSKRAAKGKTDDSPGMLKRLANLVGLGSSPSKGTKKRAPAKSAGKKQSAAKSAAKKKSAAGSKKAAKGTARKSASKAPSSRKAASRTTSRTASKRTTATRGGAKRKTATKKRSQSR